MKLPITKIMVYRILLDNDGSVTGYKMTKIIPYQHQGIYRVLKQAREKGLIDYQLIQQSDRPDAKNYFIRNEQGIIDEMVGIVAAKINPVTVGINDIDGVLTCEKYVGSNLVVNWLERLKKEFEVINRFHISETKSFVEHMIVYIEVELRKRKDSTLLQS